MEIVFTLILLIGMGFNSYRFEQRKIELQETNSIYETTKELKKITNDASIDKNENGHARTLITVSGRNVSVKILKKEKDSKNSSNLYQNSRLYRKLFDKT
ncbi:MAG: hypothetical protein JSS63_04410 [Bacteroidetes bacterium]|nr:hypothetical protein [Bacteroidota bacterium]